FALDDILRDMVALHQRQAPAQLCRTLPALGGMAVELQGDGGVALNPDTLFGQHRQQVDRTRQFGLGGAAEVACDLATPLFVLGAWRQGEGIAETAFRAALCGRALVPAMRLPGIAQRLRAAAQDIAEQCLTLG